MDVPDTAIGERGPQNRVERNFKDRGKGFVQTTLHNEKKQQARRERKRERKIEIDIKRA